MRDLESQLQSLLKDFTYQIRETVRAIDDPGGAAKAIQRSGAADGGSCAGSSASNSTPSWWRSTAGLTGETAMRSPTWCVTSPWETR